VPTKIRGTARPTAEATAIVSDQNPVAVTALDDVLFPGSTGRPAREDLISALTGVTAHGGQARPDGGPR
jgi:hypothetical protein